MWRNCVDEEKRWADYLFKDGSTIGPKRKFASVYVESLHKRLKALGLKTIYTSVSKTLP